jgi:thioredoxin-related protein
MKKLFSMLIFLPLLLKAQENGIHFEQGLSWKQIKEKAKKEHKYIFADCYTTWCGPCKEMEKEVYPDSKVGDYFNTHFISAKVQLDRTINDDEHQKRWYKDADAIQREYGIPAYPTFLFFSPEGKLINKEVGFKGANDFLAIGEKTTAPGYTPPYQRFYTLLKKYQQGSRDYEIMPALIDTSRFIGLGDLSDSISGVYLNYLQNAKDQELYSKANIQFLASYIKGSKSIFFHVFYPDQNRVDSVMNERGYAQLIVDRIIRDEEIDPPLHTSHYGMKSSAGSPKQPEPDWGQLIKKIQDKYPGDYGERLIAVAKVDWFSDQHDWGNCAKAFTDYILKYPAISDDESQNMFINSICDGTIFKWSIDKEQIDAAIEYLGNMIENRLKKKNDKPVNLFFIDTYANLLYKADRGDDAINWEEKAKKLGIETGLPNGYMDEILSRLGKMKNGEPTWPHYISKDNF